MAMPATNAQLVRRYCIQLLLSYHFLWALASAESSNALPPKNNVLEAIGVCRENLDVNLHIDVTPSNVFDAINLCRDKVKVNPHSPRIQHSLAQLLDSQIYPADVDTALVDEVIQLYDAVGIPSPGVTEKNLPTAKVRFEALTRAGTISKDILNDTHQAIKYFSSAIHIDGIEESSLLSAFETIMPIIIGDLIEVTISPKGDVSGNQHSRMALDLCDMVETKCPTASIVDEYRGAILIKLKDDVSSFNSYTQAVMKSKKNLTIGDGDACKDIDEIAKLVGNFVRASIHVAAVSKEVGLSDQRQMRYFANAEEVAAPFFRSLDGKQHIGQNAQEDLRDLIVDLYKSMGLYEEKHGSLSRARDFFLKALKINPKDGHALTQFAKLDNGDDVDSIISSVKELDPKYVTALFDEYSSKFEHHLVDILQWTGHISVFRALVNVLEQTARSPLEKIVDLGCGTGLLGEIIANEMPWVEVFGVDLSAKMIEIARGKRSKHGKKVYTSISNEDAAEYLTALEKQSVDCILATDVLVYIGDIANVLEGSSKCLVKDGLVGFTVESYEGSNGDGGLRLLKSGRFGHSRSYIDEVANSKGFEVLSWEDTVLRKQMSKDVKGAAVILKKIK